MATRWRDWGSISVVAHPVRSRDLEATLRAAGHLVHRTPAGVGVLLPRLQPDLGVVALDAPGGNALAAVQARWGMV